MKGVRTSTIQLYKIIVRFEQRDGPPRPSAHHGKLKKIKKNISDIVPNVSNKQKKIGVNPYCGNDFV